jgi:hypothetical protein
VVKGNNVKEKDERKNNGKQWKAMKRKVRKTRGK